MALSKEEKRELFEEFKKELTQAKKVYVEVCNEGVELPEYATIGDAGMDIRAAEEVIIFPGETKLVSTGLKMVIPQGYKLIINPRSGISFNTPLRIANTPGTIDSGYRGEIKICINNLSSLVPYNVIEQLNLNVEPYLISEKGNKHGIYCIKERDRIAQIILSKYETIDFEMVEDVKVFGLNRGGGFGSTGIK